MKIERINYKKIFPIAPYVNESIGVEIQLDDGDTPEHALDLAKLIVEDWHKASNPELKFDPEWNAPPMTANFNSIPTTQIKKEPKEAAIDSQVEAIAGCTTLKSLEIFKKLVDREAVPRLTEAFYKKQQELQ